jgi:hypothetical protein
MHPSMQRTALNHIHAALPHLVSYGGFILLREIFTRTLTYSSRKFVCIQGFQLTSNWVDFGELSLVQLVCTSFANGCVGSRGLGIKWKECSHIDWQHGG